VAEHLLEERSLLTPEQETNFNQFMRTSLCPLGFNAAQGLSGCREPGCGSGHGAGGHGAGDKPGSEALRLITWLLGNRASAAERG